MALISFARTGTGYIVLALYLKVRRSSYALGFVLTGLSDSWLSFRWYDAQGCIASKAVDMVAQLPFVVMTVALLQRFDSSMRGRGNFDLSIPLEGKQVQFHLPADVRPHWELLGRHGACAVPIPITPIASVPSHSRPTRARSAAAANAESAEALAMLFFKISWRLEHVASEVSVIQIARERAKHYLPHPEYVLDHMPDVESNRDYHTFSTCHIREYLSLDTDSARVPSTLVMQKFQELDSLDAENFQRYIWQIIRCESPVIISLVNLIESTPCSGIYLLWQIGVVHGDISYWNLMVDASGETSEAMLIDYDHAFVVEPGTRSPNRPGFQHIGTRPFMALDIGIDIDPDFVIHRVFRHDLESVLWCIVWYCHPQREWLVDSWGMVAGAKRAWALRSNILKPPRHLRKGTTELWKCAVQAVNKWLPADLNADGVPGTDQDWLNIIHTYIPCPEELGTDWMTFRVPPERIRPEDKDPGA
jgi:Fungal protein kinase